MKKFSSKYDIEEKVSFLPMKRHCEAYQITDEKSIGTIVAIRFTKAKVFYDIIDDYYGFFFDNVDSANVG